MQSSSYVEHEDMMAMALIVLGAFILGIVCAVLVARWALKDAVVLPW